MVKIQTSCTSSCDLDFMGVNCVPLGTFSSFIVNEHATYIYFHPENDFKSEIDIPPTS